MFLIGLISWQVGLVTLKYAYDLTAAQYFGIAFVTLGVVVMAWENE